MRDSTVRHLSTFHRLLYQATGGRVGRRLVGNDMLVLTTKGRKTGTAHSVPLLYLNDGDRMVVIASYGGRPDDPDWYKNLVSQPEAEVQIAGRRMAVKARIANDAERAIWWPRILSAYRGYGEYATRTERQIPVVFLQPN